MAIRARGDVFQIDVSYKGKRGFATALTLDEARMEEARLLERLHAAVTTSKKEASTWTLEFACTQTLKRAWAGTRSEAKNFQIAGYLQQFFGKDTLLCDITTARLDDYKDHLQEQQNCPSTINRRLAVLSKILCLAVSRDGLSKEAKPQIELEDVTKGRIRVLTSVEEEQLLGLLAQWDKLPQREMATLLIDTGMRPSEPYGLTSQDVTLTNKAGTVTVWQNKTDKPRTLPLTQRSREILTKRLAAPGPLFSKELDGLEGIWRRLRPAMKLQEDPEFVPYCFRHTCATRLVRAGVSLPAVQMWMGHKKLDTTLLYVHLNPTDLVAALGLVESGTRYAR